MTWRGSYMTDGDAFAYGEHLGLARAVLLISKAADETEDRKTCAVLKALTVSLLSPGVYEAIDWINEQERKKAATTMPTIERDAFIRVVAMDADGAREFCVKGFGMDPALIEKIEDGGSPGQPEKYKDGAHCWHVYTKKAELAPYGVTKKGAKR